jgi:hypothetical protein
MAAFVFSIAIVASLPARADNSAQAENSAETQRLLYVAVPGIRDYLQYGGHGVLVFDIDNGHKLVRRIPSAGLNDKGKPINVKGICVSVALQRLYVSTIESLISFDLTSGKIVWEKKYEGGCDRMAISPDGRTIYLPSFEKDHWFVINAEGGEILARVEPQPGAHNTNYGADGKEAYLAGLRTKTLAITDTSTHKIVRQVGPFTAAIRPFTVNGSQTLGYMCVNDLLGYEIGDLKSGKMLSRVEVQGFMKGPVARHGCPSHGIGLTPMRSRFGCATHSIVDCTSSILRPSPTSKSRASKFEKSQAGSLLASMADTPIPRQAK